MSIRSSPPFSPPTIKRSLPGSRASQCGRNAESPLGARLLRAGRIDYVVHDELTELAHRHHPILADEHGHAAVGKFVGDGAHVTHLGRGCLNSSYHVKAAAECIDQDRASIGHNARLEW